MSKLVTTVLGVGYLRPAPGTWGSLAALPLFWVLHVLGGFWLALIAVVVMLALGWWATQQEIAGKANQDPSEIVIDEVVGQWIALLPVSFGAGMMGVDVLRLWPGWVAGFLLFRLFDIWKPWLVGMADRRGGAFGVMLDDVIAGVFAALVAIVLAGVAHGFLM
ncbi:phosphatidylglycerophosphatase A family protein [Puniceibacterium sediminis]|uniref:Phosphatidylglycerophosphatase A n=1 Tax=Puniceibacterium sediminis TaxID=1608407 RepID=A0A238YKT0_9RHOB|nr:phosphatidylglycerophosphatase A [Puniceibacterium sediminis]SNR71019.1 phosphatidylglycerophosphatase A [Puniceibacterium sediminis]